MMYTHSSPEPSETEDANDFAALAPRLQKRIDGAFDRAIQQAVAKDSTGILLENATASSSADDGGGFLPPDADDGGSGFMPMDVDDSGGGFIVDDASPSKVNASKPPRKEVPTHIPLSVIPRALQILDIPQDTDVLAIFENAASGWSGQRVGEEQGVSRKDWRAVCAILFADPTATGMQDSSDDEIGREQDDEEEDLNQDEEDVYEESSEEDREEDDADSDYGQAAVSSKKPTRKTRSQRRRSSSDPPSPSGPYTLTSRQKKECRIAYALFFPEVPEKDLGKQRVKIKDVAAAAKLANNRLTMEEIVEMLEFFSTSPDKSLGLSDFEQMMMRTGQV